MRAAARLRRFADATHGGVAIISALVMAASLAAAGLVTDSALAYLHKRSLQGATDLAAMIAARDLGDARTIAARTLGDNGFASTQSLDVAIGRYEADPAIAEPARFTAGATPANAVRVRAASTPPVVLWHAVAGSPAPRVDAEAVAVSTAVAAFSIGSRLASLEGGVLNALLGGLLGSQIGLHVMDYRALADAHIDLYGLMDRLAVHLDVAGEGYKRLIGLSAPAAEVTGAAAAMLDEEPGQGTAARAMAHIAAAASGAVAVAELFDPGPSRRGSAAVGGMSATVSALDLAFAVARLADGARQADVATSLALPGLAGLDLRVVIGEPPQSSAWVTVGSAGARVHTAQTRVYLRARIGGTGPLSGVALEVPLYAEVAAGVAELADVHCAMWRPDEARASIAARPGVAAAWLGTIDEDDLPRFGRTIRPQRAQLASIPLARISAHANVEAANPGTETLVFTAADVAAGTVRTVRTSAFAGPVLGSLLSRADVRVEALGLGLGLPTGLTGLVGSLLSGAAAPLDAALAGVLRVAGVGLGEADVSVGGIRCDGSALVR